jgi:hypothetical protein
MSDRKVVQVVLDDDQRAVIEIVLKLTNTKVSALVRRMLVEWAATQLHVPGVIRGGACAARCGGVCAVEPATWFNTANKHFVCEPCALYLNERQPICVLAVDEHQSAINVEKLRALAVAERDKIKSTKTEEELVSDLLRAADAYASRPRETRTKGFDALVERFS